MQRRAAAAPAAIWWLLLQLLGAGSSISTSTTADDGAGLPLVPQLNQSGSVGIFWSCGSSIKFTICSTKGNATCAAETTVVTTNSSITAADVYYDSSELYYISNGSAVYRLKLHTAALQMLYVATPGLELSDIAVDWLNQELYLVRNRQILRCDMNISSCSIIPSGEAADAREITVDPNNGYIFWTAHDGAVWRGTLPSDGAAAASRSQPVTIAAADSSCPQKGFTTVSQLGVIYVYFHLNRHCGDTHTEVASVVFNRTGSVGPVISKYTNSEQHNDGQQPSAISASIADSRGGLVCASNASCMWMEADGRLRIADFDRNMSVAVGLALLADGRISEGGRCLVLAPWHRDLQAVPTPLSSPRNLEVIFSASSAVVSWEPPNPNLRLAWKNRELRPIFESMWRNWMYKVLVSANSTRVPSTLPDVSLTPPEAQTCHVPPLGINKCLFNGLTPRWTYNVSVIAYSAAGNSPPKVVYGSTPKDDTPLLLVTTTGLAYSLLRFSDGTQYGAAVGPAGSSSDGGTLAAVLDVAATSDSKMYMVLANKTLVLCEITTGLHSPSGSSSSGSNAGLSPRIDTCALASRAEAVTWDWVSSSLYVATEAGILRSASGCTGGSELLTSEPASALALEPLSKQILFWITADRKELKYCKLGVGCAASVTTIFRVSCRTPVLNHCVESIRSLAVDVDEGAVYWSLLSPPSVKIFTADLAQLSVWRELSNLQAPSIPSIAAYGGKLLLVINGTKLQVRDVRGDAMGQYPLARPASGLWLLLNYTLWLLPGFSNLEAMQSATRPAQISNDTSQLTVEGTWWNFTIYWPYLNKSALVDVRYNVTVSGAGIDQRVSFASSPSINIISYSVQPYTLLRVTVLAFTPWVTGEPFTTDIFSPARVPPAPEGLQNYVEDTVIHMYWDQQYLPGAPVSNTTVAVAIVPENDSFPLNYSVIGSAIGNQRHFSFPRQATVPAFFVKVLSCNMAGCSATPSPLWVSTRAGEFTPLSRVVILWASGLLETADFRLTLTAAIDIPRDNVPVKVAAFVGDHGLTLVWIDSTGCIYQKLSEASDIVFKVTCGLTLPASISVENSRRRLYIVQNGSAVVQVDLVNMQKETVFQSAGQNITAITFHEQKRKLYVLTGARNVVEVHPGTHQEQRQTRSSSNVEKLEADMDCNCSDVAGTTPSLPRSVALVPTDDGGDAVAIYYLDKDGTVWRTNSSTCHCWPIVSPSMLGMPGFIPDGISAGGYRLYLYSRLQDRVVSVDLLGRHSFLLENVKIQDIWAYSTDVRSFFVRAPRPLLERVTVLNPNEARITWQSSATTTFDAYFLVWPVPQNGTRPQAVVTSMDLPYSPFSIPRLLPATKYNMQIWVCGRGDSSCSHSNVSAMQTPHAPGIPAATNATNVSLTFVWTAPPDDSVISHYIRVDSVTGTETVKSAATATTSGRQYTMTIHYLEPATDYLARVVVVYKASSPREYQWPLDGVKVSTKCSSPTNVTISSVDCGSWPNSSCTLKLSYVDSRLISKCHVSFVLNLNCHESEGNEVIELLKSPIPEFVVPISDVHPLGRREACSAFARAASPDGEGHWSSLVWLSIDSGGEPAEEGESDLASVLIGVGAGVAVIAVVLGVGLYLRRRRIQKQSLGRNRARREDRRSPDAGGPQSEDNIQLVVLHRDPGFDMLTNTAYQTEGVLREPATANGSSNGSCTLPKLDRQAVKLLRPLGAGAFGEVHAGIVAVGGDRDGEQIPTPVAVKTLRSDATALEKSEFLKEAALMSQFHHENVVKLIGICADADPLYIVIELMNEGDLLNFVRRKRPTKEAAGQLSLHMLLHMSFDIASGCEFLESLHFVHRDLAARNCLVSTSGHADGCPFVKIGDFGLARDVYRNDYYRKEGEALLPVRWMSPESLVDGVFTNHSDVWSFGVLMWEVFSLGMQPYAAKSNVEVLYFVRNAGTLDRPLRCPLSMFQLMSQCWSYVPQERPSFKAVRCSVQQILTEADQDTSLVAAYDRCNGRLSSDQEFFSTSSAPDDGPMSARMVRQLSDVFVADGKPPAAEGPVELRSQSAIKGRLSKIFRRSANNSLLNRVHSQTDPESRKSNVYVRSDSVLSNDAVASRLLSISRDESSNYDDELHHGNFGDFVLDSIAADQSSDAPRAVPAAHGSHVEAVSYSFVTPAAKHSMQGTPDTSCQAAAPPRTHAATPVDVLTLPHGNAYSDAVDGGLGATGTCAGKPTDVDYSVVVVGLPTREAASVDSFRAGVPSDTIAGRSGINAEPLDSVANLPDDVHHSHLVALPPRCTLLSDDNICASCTPHSVGEAKAADAVKKSVPNSYTFDVHRTDDTVAAAPIVKRPTGRRQNELGLKAIDYSGSEPVSK